MIFPAQRTLTKVVIKLLGSQSVYKVDPRKGEGTIVVP